MGITCDVLPLYNLVGVEAMTTLSIEKAILYRVEEILFRKYCYRALLVNKFLFFAIAGWRYLYDSS